METYEEIVRGMAARGHRHSATECHNKTKGLRADYNVKPHHEADSYQFPPIATPPTIMALEVPSSPAEGSEELFTMVLELIEGGYCIQRDGSGPSDSTPEEDVEQLPDTDATNLGSPKDSDVDPGAIISEITPVEHLNIIRARKKCVTAVQRVGEPFLKAAAHEQAVYLEAAKQEHDELMQEMRASRQEEREARESRGPCRHICQKPLIEPGFTSTNENHYIGASGGNDAVIHFPKQNPYLTLIRKVVIGKPPNGYGYALLIGDRQPHVCPLVLDPSMERLHQPVEGGTSHSKILQPLLIIPDFQNEGVPPLC
ncbi:UNVERIFIED_CONTAM: hypothetical protein K2H54_059237 [Gekko kuhli]